MQLELADVDAICGLVMDLCGVYLDESKSYLIESRLREVAERAGCQNYKDLVQRARSAVDPNLKREIVDAITTQETLFFRDTSPFDGLQHPRSSGFA